MAGSAAALELGRRGLRVALLEKARHPRPKACGEGLLPHGVAALRELGLDFPGVRVRGLRYVSPGGVTAEADFPSGYGMVVRREKFDAFVQNRLMPSLQGLGDQGFQSPPDVKEFPVHNLQTP